MIEKINITETKMEQYILGLVLIMPQIIELPYINNENATKKVIASNLGPMITPQKTQGGATNIISSNICGIMINLFIGGLIAIEPQLKVLFFT